MLSCQDTVIEKSDYILLFSWIRQTKKVSINFPGTVNDVSNDKWCLIKLLSYQIESTTSHCGTWQQSVVTTSAAYGKFYSKGQLIWRYS